MNYTKRRFIHEFQGDRFGGALDAAAKQFSKAFDSGMLPMEFVNKMKKDGKLIMGIGHRVKSVSSTLPQVASARFLMMICSRLKAKCKTWGALVFFLFVWFFLDQQPGHAGSDTEGLCEAAFHLHPAT